MGNYYWVGKGSQNRIYYIDGSIHENAVGGYTIRNIHLRGSGVTTNNRYYGFFSDAKDIVFYNVNFEFSSVNNDKIVGDKNGLLIGNCVGNARFRRVNVTLNSDFATSYNYTGGLAGYVAKKLTVDYTTLTVNGVISGREYVGGCAGFAQNISSTETSVIANKTINDKESGFSASNTYVAGFVGRLNGNYTSSLKDCKSEVLSLSGNARVAGFFGEVSSANVTFTGCSFKASV